MAEEGGASLFRELAADVGGSPLWPFGVADPLWLRNLAPELLRVEIRGFSLPIPGPWKGPGELVVVKEKEEKICITGMDTDTEEAWGTAAAWASGSGDRPRPGPMWEGEEEAFPVAGLIRGMVPREQLVLLEWSLQPPAHGPGSLWSSLFPRGGNPHA